MVVEASDSTRSPSDDARAGVLQLSLAPLLCGRASTRGKSISLIQGEIGGLETIETADLPYQGAL